MVFGPGFNFAQVPVRKPDFDLAGPIMQGFQLGRIPQQMADQRQAQQIANALREAQTRKAGLEADYLPEQQKLASRGAEAIIGERLANAARAKMQVKQLEQQMGLDNLIRNSMTNVAQDDVALANQGMPQENAVGQGLGAMMPGQAMAQQAQSSQPAQAQAATPQLIPSASSPARVITINQGNPKLSKADELYDQMPITHSRFKQLIPDIGPLISKNDNTGETIITKRYPSGKITQEVIQTGMRPGDVAFQKERAKGRAQQIKVLEDERGANSDQRDILNKIKNTVEQNYDDFKNVTGPVDSVLARYFGTPAQQKMLGALWSDTGNIVLNAAKSIKGAFTGRDLGLINSIKPSPKDMPAVFLGKLQAMQELAEIVDQKKGMVIDLMDQGYSRNQAEKIVKKSSYFNDAINKVGQDMQRLNVWTDPNSVKIDFNKMSDAQLAKRAQQLISEGAQ